MPFMSRPRRLAAGFLLLAACGGSIDIQTTGGAGGAGAGSSSGAGASSSSVQGSGGTGVTVGTGGAGAGATGSTGSGGGMICPGFGDPCTSCLSAACPAIFCSCSNNADCLALSACLNNCGGASDCAQACQTAHENGIADLYALSGCAGASCPSECPGNDPLDPCIECVLDTCPMALSACLADAECVALYHCLGGCGEVDLVCQQGCYAQHGAGTVKLTALLQCEKAPCGSACK